MNWGMGAGGGEAAAPAPAVVEEDGEAGKGKCKGKGWRAKVSLNRVAVVLWVVASSALWAGLHWRFRRAALRKAEEGLVCMCEERARMLQDQFAVSVNHVHALAILVATFHYEKHPPALDQVRLARSASTSMHTGATASRVIASTAPLRRCSLRFFLYALPILFSPMPGRSSTAADLLPLRVFLVLPASSIAIILYTLIM